MTRLGTSIPSRLGAMDGLAAYARAADAAGFDSVWAIELYRNPFTMLYGMAPAARNVLLGTDIGTAMTRGPEAERDAVVDALNTKGLAGLEESSDRLVEAYSINGTPEEACQKLEAFQAEIPQVILHTPYVPPITEEQSRDAFDGIVSAFAPTRAPAGVS